MVGGTATAAISAAVGIGNDFVNEVKGLMKPGTEDMDVILHTIRGLGGKVLKTNVDRERAQLIQSTLGRASATDEQSAGQ
jgi:uncharacterized membrane protein